MSQALSFANVSSPIAWQGKRAINRAQLLRDIAGALSQLPEADFAINRCTDRYAFLVSFLAVALKGQTNILPANQLQQPLADIASRAAGRMYCLQAHPDRDRHPAINTLTLKLDHPSSTPAVISIAPGAVAARVFTSGSTGQPVMHSKTWQHLLAGSQALTAGLGARLPAGASLVATVPPQHMFGLETTILLPLLQELSVHSGRPFFPADIRAALAAVPAPRLLISTPVHLRACLEAALDWPELAGVYSSTGPLSQSLAQQVGQRLACPVTEIYGASETGAIAWRNALAGDPWRLLPGMQLQLAKPGQAGGVLLRGPQLSQPVELADQLELLDEQRFKLLGRSREVVKLAGKRVALGELNQRLNDIEGVQDGVFFIPDEADEDRSQRLLAVVVADRISDAWIRQQLARHIDPVFLPRSIVRVAHLPRDTTGKLPRSAVAALLK